MPAVETGVVLFNTLAYAKFFALVFVVSWALVNRRTALLLPWLAVLGVALTASPSAPSLGVVLASFALTLALQKQHTADGPPPPSLATASVLMNGIALSFLTFSESGVDPLSAGLAALGVPVPRALWWTVPATVALLFVAYTLVTARKLRLLFILGASYVFYAHWDWRFLPLIWGSSTVDWLLGHAIHRARTPRSRKLWLTGTVIVNLGVLGIFKYFNFGVDTASSVLTALGFEAPDVALRIALPIGVSFFTFESMSYVIDVYRGDLEPQKSYVEYLSFVAFFPHLVAGPIVRPRDLLPQLAGPARWNAREASEGVFLIAVGLLKKVAIGDYLAVNLVDRVFDAPIQYSALECYSAVIGYALQIYCDFSGYTDIAIGSALLLGVRFPPNFDAPYKAKDIQDFWRRWHISLSTWLRDYLYIPLGGNRKGEVRTYVNLMLTMLLGGLWHGAAWTFVVWGGLHGGALAVHRYVTRRPGARTRASSSALVTVLKVLGTFHLVCAGWIFFRAESFQHARVMFTQLATLTTFHPNLHWQVVAMLAVGLISHWLPERWYEGSRRFFIEAPAPVQGVLLFFAAIVLREMASADAVPFVYFQF